MNACLSELRESMAGEMLPAFNPVCHMVKGSRRDEIVRLAVSMEADLVVVGTWTLGNHRLIQDSTGAAITKQWTAPCSS